MRRTLLLLSVIALTGCYTDGNSRQTLGDDVGLSIIDPEAEVTYLDLPPSPPLNVMRTGWERTEFLVPVDGTDHVYLGRTDLPCTDQTARQRREYPTPESATDTDGDSIKTQRREAIEAPFWAAWDCLLLLPRLIGWQAANQSRAVSPDVNYARYPSDEITPVERALWLGESR